jgi:hypothetical protein
LILTKKDLDESMNILRGVMMIAYPGYHGVEEYEPAREILEGNLEVVYRFEASEVIYLLKYLDEETSLWWASKELLVGKLLSDYTGKNEKTKIV